MRKNPRPTPGLARQETNRHVLRSGHFLHVAVAACVLLFAGLAAPSAQAALITYFNFEDANLVSDVTAVPPPVPGSTIMTDFAPGAPGVGGYTFPMGQGSTLNLAPGDLPPVTNTSLRLDTDQGANNDKWIEFSVTSVILSNLSLSYATRHFHGQAFTAHTLSYSINGGAFVTVGTFVPNSTSNAYEVASFDLSGIPALNGQAVVAFRLTFDGAGNGNNEATDIDNFQLNAIAVAPEPGTLVGAALALAAMGIMQRRRLRTRLTRVIG